MPARLVSLKDIPQAHKTAYVLIQDGLYENEKRGWENTLTFRQYIGAIAGYGIMTIGASAMLWQCLFWRPLL